jgi:uncharacterized protein (TIRG00374 family)
MHFKLSSPVKIALLFFITVLILLGMVTLTGVDETLIAIVEAGLPAFFVTGAVLFILLVLQTLVITILSKPIGHKIPFLVALKAITTGFAANIITPSSYLGGEPIKVLYIGRKARLSYTEVAGSILLAKYLEFLAFLLILGMSIASAVYSYMDILFRAGTTPLGLMLVILAMVSLLLFGILWWSLSNRRHPISSILKFVKKIFPRWNFLDVLIENSIEMETQASRVFCEEGNEIFFALVLYILMHLLSFSRPLFFFELGWHTRLRLGQLSLLFIVFQLLHIVQVTPSAIGTLDGAMFGIIAYTGMDSIISPPRCAAFLLCLRFWDFVFVSVGAVLAARMGLKLLSLKQQNTAEKKETLS